MPIFRFAGIFLAAALCATPRPLVTWSHDVAPIVYAHCAGCHREGQPVPFPLLSYQDARAHGPVVARVVEARYMPPWLPVAGFGHFEQENQLTASQISIIARWAQTGFREGDPRIAPLPPKFASTWQLGSPDAILRLPKPATVSAEGPDSYRCFVIPTSFPGDRYVRAFQLHAGAPASGSSGALHHALMFVDARVDPGRGSPLPESYECFGTPGFLPTAGLGGWTPGAQAVSMPPATGIRIPRGARIVVQLHFHPTGKVEQVDPSLALYFSAEAPTRVLMDVPLGSNRIDIPAGDAHYTVRDEFELPVPVQVVGIIPHAHYICKDMKAWAVLPGGRKRWLLWIKDWNFNWQEQYRYSSPFVLPAGTRLGMQFTYDNSDANVRNPNHPAARVRWGAFSTDEMAGVHIQVIPRNEEDMHELGQAQWGKFMRSVGGKFFTLGTSEPEKTEQE